MDTIVALGCLFLGIRRFYELSQKKDTFSKSEIYFRIGTGVILIALGCILIARML